MGKWRPFEPIEDELITDRRLAGLGTTVIAKELYRLLGSRRSQATINMRLKTLAAKDEAADFDEDEGLDPDRLREDRDERRRLEREP